jgi:outer membrane receptor protein involved in Fe transport
VTEHTRLGLNGFVRTLDAEQFNANLIGADTRAFQHTTSAGGTLQLDHEALVLGRKNRLTLGMEYVHHAVAETVLAEEADTSTLDSKVSDRQHTFALYAQDGLQPGVAGTHTFSRVTPRLGVNYNVTPVSGLYLAFAQGIRAPAFLELTCASPRTVCPGLQAGVAADPPLKTVQASHYEIGGRLALGDVKLELSLFRTDLSNDIFSISPTGTTGLFFQNVGTTRRQGVELSSEVSLGRRWDLRLGYTYTEATFIDDVDLATPRRTPGCVATPCTQHVRAGSSLPLVPRHRLNARVEHRLTSWLTLWVSGAFVGSQRLRGDEENVERMLDPYVVLDAGARIQWQQLSGFVTIGNALDDAHETFGTFAANAGRPGSPVEPFSRRRRHCRWTSAWPTASEPQPFSAPRVRPEAM